MSKQDKTMYSYLVDWCEDPAALEISLNENSLNGYEPVKIMEIFGDEEEEEGGGYMMISRKHSDETEVKKILVRLREEREED